MHSDSELPHVRSRVLIFRSLFTLHWGTGLLLAGCFFLPLARGCSEEVIYPSGLTLASFEHVGSTPSLDWIVATAHATWIARPYLYGLLLASFTLVAIVVRGPQALETMNRFLLVWSYISIACLGLVLIAQLGDTPPASLTQLLAKLGYWLCLAVPPVMLLCLQLGLLRKGHVWWALTAGQTGWAILGALRFGFWLDPRETLIGGKVALACCLLMVETARLQHRHGRWLFNPSVPRRTVQYDTRYLLAATLAAAIFLAWVAAPLTPLV